MTVAVIIPAYNIGDYLPECLDSVLSQTHRELEIIVVDDGSTDHSGRVADDYARRDPRVRVIHKANGGLSDARNAGLDVVTAPFVTMIDGDDVVHPRYVELLLAAATATAAPITVAPWRKFTGPCPAMPALHAVEPQRYDAPTAIDAIFYQEQLNNSACSRLFDTTLFKSVRFPRGKLYEDIAIIYDLVTGAGSVAFVDLPLYYYRQKRRGSITHLYTPARYDIIEILDALYDRLATDDPARLPALRSRRVSAAFNLLGLLRDDERERIAHCWDIITTSRVACLRDRRVRLKNKAALLVSFLGRPLTRLLATHL